MRIKIGTNTFPATLYDNATAAAFKSLLPMTVNMAELNGNEKYFDLSGDLPIPQRLLGILFPLAEIQNSAINLRGVFQCMKYEIPLMLKQGGARS